MLIRPNNNMNTNMQRRQAEYAKRKANRDKAYLDDMQDQNMSNYGSKDPMDDMHKELDRQMDQTSAAGYSPPPKPTGVSSNGSYIDAEYEQRMRDLMRQGVRNTAQEEALAAKNNERMLGKTLADQRARAGFAGFGLSGAAQAEEMSTRQQAADQLLNQLLGIQQGARDEYRQNMALAGGMFDKEAERKYGAEQGDLNRAIDWEDVNLRNKAYDKIVEVFSTDDEEERRKMISDLAANNSDYLWYALTGKPTPDAFKK